MQNIILVIHLILAVCLIGVVLLQRSEGGALGIGGGGGGGFVSARGAASALGKVTWMIGVGFLCTSISLAIVSSERQDSSIFDTIVESEDQSGELPLPVSDEGEVTLPDLPDEPESPIVPQAAE